METDREAATTMEPTMEEEPKTEHTERSSGWRSWVWENTGVAYDVAHLNRADPFFVKRSGVTWWTEIRAGTVTFLTMSFILPVNALIMSIAIGEEHKDDLVVATAVVSAVSSALMGLLANYPFGLAPGMVSLLLLAVVLASDLALLLAGHERLLRLHRGAAETSGVAGCPHRGLLLGVALPHHHHPRAQEVSLLLLAVVLASDLALLLAGLC